MFAAVAASTPRCPCSHARLRTCHWGWRVAACRRFDPGAGRHRRGCGQSHFTQCNLPSPSNAIGATRASCKVMGSGTRYSYGQGSVRAGCQSRSAKETHAWIGHCAYAGSCGSMACVRSHVGLPAGAGARAARLASTKQLKKRRRRRALRGRGRVRQARVGTAPSPATCISPSRCGRPALRASAGGRRQGGRARRREAGWS